MIEDDDGRMVWEDSIQHVKLSLMKSDIFQLSDQVSKQNEGISEIARLPTSSPTDLSADDPDDSGDVSELSPYDSAAS